MGSSFREGKRENISLSFSLSSEPHGQDDYQAPKYQESKLGDQDEEIGWYTKEHRLSPHLQDAETMFLNMLTNARSY